MYRRIAMLLLVVVFLVLSGCTATQSEPEPAVQPQAASESEPQQESTVPPIPYVGMYVSAVPHDWQWQGTDYSTVIGLSGHKTTRYRYDTASKVYLIWVDAHGKVVKVTYTEVGGGYSSSGNHSSGSSGGYNQNISGSHSSGSGGSLSPSSGVSDFTHPDDFYYWYPDDFVDYEEAEDYYYSH